MVLFSSMFAITTVKSSMGAMNRARRERGYATYSIKVIKVKNEASKCGKKEHSGLKTLKNVYQKIGNICRYYYKDEDEFENDLARFNKSLIKTSMTLSNELYFVCVGLANVNLRFCTKCSDVEKDNQQMDLYYVNKKDVGQQRTTLCRGCLGHELQEKKREKGSVETLV